ncbi:hypothetical protein [Shewanella violacea]|uniref:Lipoprotein n=1 Tax=Shewanella violacea (strain JCM 10179 / CIP 106290 / LMG 19151 / DSS12) TaxID=637905 RepID=D4ZGN8_SHEVD|nr:hypothetical protein [Shewanella violacea]BAJ00837.1 hypothetical protein SVI_0866 [Shewanella violacea DSS12]
MKRVVIITALLGISACATNIDFDSDDSAMQDTVEAMQDPMIKNNQHMIEDARRDGRMERD